MALATFLLSEMWLKPNKTAIFTVS